MPPTAAPSPISHPMTFLRSLLTTRTFHSAAGLLVMLLQRTPAVRLLVTAEAQLTAPAASVLRAILPTAAALGAVHSMAGATTQLVASIAQPARATVGVAFTEGIAIQGLGVSYAQSWAVGNALPPGIVAQGAVLQGTSLVVSPSNGTLILSGTPTTAGTYTFAVSGYQFVNLGGPVTNATAQIIVAPAPNAAPAITRQPASATAVVGGSVTLSVAYTGSPAPTFQWAKDGAAISSATSATLVLSSVTLASAGNYTVTITNSLGNVTSAAATITVNPAPAAPVFTSNPVAQTVNAGGAVTLSADATGVPTPTLQWLKDGVAIAGATDVSLNLANLQAADAGTYSVVATSSAGATTSAAALVIVNSAPVFVAPPLAQTVAANGSVVFSAKVVGTPAPKYQWQRNGVNVAGATGPMLLLSGLNSASAGSYTCVATNSLGSAVSPAAALAVSTTNDLGRLINLAILTDISAEVPSFTLGTIIGGSGAKGTKPLVIRADGPALGAFGVFSPLPAPQLSLVASNQAVIGKNANWGGTDQLRAAFAQVGAFAFSDPASRDAALVASVPTDLGPVAYTVVVSGVGGATGSVLAELYDATPSDTFTPASARLVNAAVLKQIIPGGSMTAGFIIGGSTAKTVLIRAIGPGLASVGVTSGYLADPQLTLYDGNSAVITSNNDWGGDAAFATAAQRSGSFAIADPASKDAMILVTLAPGKYTATASAASGTAGLAIVEVYEVP